MSSAKSDHAERWNYIQELLEAEEKQQNKEKKRKYISRTDNDERRAHHWTFNIRINGKRINKTFSDKKNGGKASALLACIAYRKKILEEYSVVFIDGLKKQPYSEDAEGVCFYIKKSMVKGKWYEYPTFKAYWHEPTIDGKQTRKAKCFYISKYGYKRAKQKAIKFRKEKLKELYG